MNHRPRKRFGQNFLVDPSFVEAIVDAIGATAGDQLIEIGPGRGALTQALLSRSINRLEVIEIDRDLIQLLANRFGAKIKIHHQDVLSFDFNQLLLSDQKIRLVGNLPYNISTPFLFHLIKFPQLFSDCHFMLQKEVVNRLSAEPGSRRYGRLTIMIQLEFDVDPVFDVPPTAFQPIPKVESTFVRLIPKQNTLESIEDRSLFDRIIKLAFGQRRKRLNNALSDLIAKSDWQKLTIDPTLRPEALSIADYVILSNEVSKLVEHPHSNNHENCHGHSNTRG